MKLSTLSDLKLDAKNANKGTDRGRKLLKKSLEELGIGRSILVDRAGHIIAGNKTAETLQSLKQKKIRVVQTAGDELIVVQRTDLDGEFFNDAEMRKLGITVASDEGPAPQLDRAAELQAKWKTERGQIWEIGKHRLMCGDSTDPKEVATLMAGKRAGLMATDPPYLVEYKGGSHPATKANQGSANRDKDWSESYHEIEIKDADKFFIGFISAAIASALEEHAAWYIWHASVRQSDLQRAIEAAGGIVHQQIIWMKSRAVLTYSHFMWQHEPCFYAWKQGSKPERKPDANVTTIWEVGTAGQENAEHPTQKPTELFSKPMLWHLEESGICYEPFSGSGTSLVAAEQSKRVCRAMEVEPKYVAVALERMADMGLKPKLARRSGR